MKHARKLRSTLALAAGIAVTAAALGPGLAPAAAAKDDGKLNAVRAWTDRYQSEAAAIADGSLRTDVCVPGMGYHYVNPDRIDGKLQRNEPEVVIYAPGPNNTRVLVAAEWVVVDADQDVATDGDRPTVFGLPLEGPMEGHESGMPVHYDRHAWAWLDNPAGEFATWNARVVCPQSSTSH